MRKQFIRIQQVKPKETIQGSLFLILYKLYNKFHLAYVFTNKFLSDCMVGVSHEEVLNSLCEKEFISVLVSTDLELIEKIFLDIPKGIDLYMTRNIFSNLVINIDKLTEYVRELLRDDNEVVV